MAQRRMFSKTIVDSDDFLDMPVSARLLYYDLGMRADDDGFVNPKRVMRLIGAADDDLKILLAKKYVLSFENKILVIRDWKVNNFIRPDRYTPTIYKEYLKKLEVIDTKQYKLPSGIPNDIPKVDPVKDRIGKERKDKDIILSAKADEVNYIFVKELNKLLTDKKKHIRIIGLFIKAKKYTPANSSELQAIIKRNVKVAVSLSHYSIEKIIKTLKYLKDNADFKWTLESVGKYIDENLDNLSTNKVAECHL